MKTNIFVLLFLCCSQLFSQELSKREFNKRFQDADVVFEYGADYEKAARLYESLAKIYPDNSNLVAKLGMCYLNIDGKKAEALKLLEKASSNVANSEKEYEEYGEKAPTDTYMYLAMAYQRNDSLQKAISVFSEAKRMLGVEEVTKMEYLDDQIRGCKYAIELKKKPLTMITNLFAPWLSEFPGARNPVVSKNDSVFVFTLKNDGKTRVLCSYKTDKWNRPTDITNQLGGYDRFYTNSITGDGKTLIIYMDDGNDGNLYFSERNDTTWTKVKRVGKNINSIYWESFGFITPDGKTMYISSNRPGGVGNLDIWVSEKDIDGSWTHPVNLGNVINTSFNEDTPFFDPTTKALLFSSDGHLSMGGYDIFRSVERNGTWTDPIGMPFAFNTTADNTFFILNKNGPGFITSIYDGKTKERNIFTILAEDPADKITMAHGTVNLQDGMTIDPKKMQIQLTDIKNRTPKKNIMMTDTSSYEFEIKPGDYQLMVSYKGYKTDTININVPLYFAGNYLSFNSSLVPEIVAGGDFLSIKNIFFEFNSFELDKQALTDLQTIKTILINQPDLKVEVAGYTDNIGSTAYNLKLADKRAQAAIDYLVSTGIPATRFVKKAYGKSGFIALNQNQDGSDNPEGRRINRRVTFGVIDPKTGVTISKETFTPKHLGQSYSFKYSIVLLKSSKELPESYFNNLKITEMNVIRSLKVNSFILYIVDAFNNRNDAAKYLEYAKSIGYKDAYIVNHYEVNNNSETLVTPEITARKLSDKGVYTIQLKAAKGKIDLKDFKGIDGVMEAISQDGYWRYYCGHYSSYAKAKAALETYQKSGYPDAFVRELDELVIK